MSYETINVTPVTPRIGAEVEGITLSTPLSNREVDELHQALAEHQVLFFRDQPLDVEAHKTLAAAARRARHSSSVLDPFERLHGRHAVARLVRALEPPRLKGTIWSPSSGLSAPQ